MFFSRNKDGKNKTDKKKPQSSALRGSGGETKAGQRSHSDVIREQALANARGARERLGEDYIQEMADILKKHQGKLTPEQAKAKIKSTDPDRVAAEILAMLEDKN